MIAGFITDIKSGIVTVPCYQGKPERIPITIGKKVPHLMQFMGRNKFLAGNEPTIVDFYWYEMVEVLDFVT